VVFLFPIQQIATQARSSRRHARRGMFFSQSALSGTAKGPQSVLCSLSCRMTASQSMATMVVYDRYQSIKQQVHCECSAQTHHTGPWSRRLRLPPLEYLLSKTLVEQTASSEYVVQHSQGKESALWVQTAETASHHARRARRPSEGTRSGERQSTRRLHRGGSRRQEA